MEVKKPTIKSIPYEDFKDNEYLENMVKQLNEGGTKVVVESSLWQWVLPGMISPALGLK